MNISVKREFSYDESLRKWYQCIANETLIIDEENDVKISPGQIVKIQREKTINSWPMVFIDDVDYDMTICDEFFDDFFEEFDNKILELRMSRKTFKDIFELSEERMIHIEEDIYFGFYTDYYELAVERMLPQELSDRGYYIKEGYDSANGIMSEKSHNVNSETLNYMILSYNFYRENYTISTWIEDTLKNYPEYLKNY